MNFCSDLKLKNHYISPAQIAANDATISAAPSTNPSDARTPHTLLEHLSFSVPQGENTIIMGLSSHFLVFPSSLLLLFACFALFSGPSASGKSSIPRVLAGIWPLTGGSVTHPQFGHQGMFFVLNKLRDGGNSPRSDHLSRHQHQCKRCSARRNPWSHRSLLLVWTLGPRQGNWLVRCIIRSVPLFLLAFWFLIFWPSVRCLSTFLRLNPFHFVLLCGLSAPSFSLLRWWSAASRICSSPLSCSQVRRPRWGDFSRGRASGSQVHACLSRTRHDSPLHRHSSLSEAVSSTYGTVLNGRKGFKLVDQGEDHALARPLQAQYLRRFLPLLQLPITQAAFSKATNNNNMQPFAHSAHGLTWHIDWHVLLGFLSPFLCSSSLVSCIGCLCSARALVATFHSCPDPAPFPLPFLFSGLLCSRVLDCSHISFCILSVCLSLCCLVLPVFRLSRFCLLFLQFQHSKFLSTSLLFFSVYHSLFASNELLSFFSLPRLLCCCCFAMNTLLCMRKCREEGEEERRKREGEERKTRMSYHQVTESTWENSFHGLSHSCVHRCFTSSFFLPSQPDKKWGEGEEERCSFLYPLISSVLLWVTDHGEPVLTVTENNWARLVWYRTIYQWRTGTSHEF